MSKEKSKSTSRKKSTRAAKAASPESETSDLPIEIARIAALRREREDQQAQARAEYEAQGRIVNETLDALQLASLHTDRDLLNFEMAHGRVLKGEEPVAFTLGDIIIDSVKWARRIIRAANAIKVWPGMEAYETLKVIGKGDGFSAGREILGRAFDGDSAEKIAKLIDAYRGALGPFRDGFVSGGDSEYGIVLYLSQVERQIADGNWGSVPRSAIVDVGSVQPLDAKPIAAPVPTSDDSRCIHSADFSSVDWRGVRYVFSPRQAICVRLLWQEWERGGHSLREATIGAEVDSASDEYRLRDTFRRSGNRGMHPAWGTMIVKVGESTYALSGACPRNNPV